MKRGRGGGRQEGRGRSNGGEEGGGPARRRGGEEGTAATHKSRGQDGQQNTAPRTEIRAEGGGQELGRASPNGGRAAPKGGGGRARVFLFGQCGPCVAGNTHTRARWGVFRETVLHKKNERTGGGRRRQSSVSSVGGETGQTAKAGRAGREAGRDSNGFHIGRCVDRQEAVGTCGDDDIEAADAMRAKKGRWPNNVDCVRVCV